MNVTDEILQEGIRLRNEKYFHDGQWEYGGKPYNEYAAYHFPAVARELLERRQDLAVAHEESNRYRIHLDRANAELLALRERVKELEPIVKEQGVIKDWSNR